jgi:DNA segregation ATPase FtsK/SpoIIIE, S-DNA-T family
MPSEAAATRSTRGTELLGLSAFALALMLLISLATFNPGDPSPFFKAGEGATARNFIGPFGAFLAELLVPQLFGVAALLLPLVLGLTGWKLFWCRPIEAPWTKAFGLFLLLLSLTAFLSLTFGTVSFEGEAVRAGGAVGELLAGILITDFNRTGAYIVVATALFVSLILATQFSFATFLHGAAGSVSQRLQTLHTAWTHYRETRRKERMRREVIRKHTKEAAVGEGSESLPRVRRVKAPSGPEQEREDDEEEEAPPKAAAPPAQKRRGGGAGPATGRAEEARRRAGPRRTRAARPVGAAPPHHPRRGPLHRDRGQRAPL